jgi:hypothetical protein
MERIRISYKIPRTNSEIDEFFERFSCMDLLQWYCKKGGTGTALTNTMGR